MIIITFIIYNLYVYYIDKIYALNVHINYY